MSKTARQSRSAKVVYLMLILLISSSIMQTVVTAQGQTAKLGDWALTLQTQAIGQNTTSPILAPFDQVQLNSNVTYNNATQPDILISLQIQGPIGATNPTTITRIETTNSTGQAGFTFRLPISSDSQDLTGIWLASATMQTTNGTLQQISNFTVQWPMEITVLNTLNAQGQAQTNFSPDDSVITQLSINNTNTPQTANITLIIQDAEGNIINQTTTQNTSIATSTTNLTEVQTTTQIPDNATAGQATIVAGIYEGNYNGTDIPVAQTQTALITISADGTDGASPTPTASNPSATPTPQQSPTPTATITAENTVSLFAWLLVAVGLFTFTALYMFVRRKPQPEQEHETQTLVISPEVTSAVETPNPPTPSTSQPALQAATTQEITQKPPAEAVIPMPTIAQEKPINATLTTQTPLQEPANVQTEPTRPEQVPTAVPEQKGTNIKLNRIYSTTKRIEALKLALKLEKEQLEQDLQELRQNNDGTTKNAQRLYGQSSTRN